MYKEFFGLSEAPFSISPNPKFFYLSRHHREALASLKHGTRESGGFVLFTGEVGTGKTVIVRTLIQSLPPEIRYAAIYNPDLSVNEMLEAICQGFGLQLAKGASKRELLEQINNFLLSCAHNNQRTVLLIDEAQHLSDEVLEQVRLLTNYETNNTKLLQVVLVGQPELAQKLKQQHLRQLAQRITARFHLLPLTVMEVDSYVRFRLQSAGCLQVIFTNGAVAKLYSYSKGIPRIINVIADRALLAAFVDRSHTVEAKHVKQAAQEVLGLESLSTVTKKKLSSLLLLSSLGKYVALGVSGLVLGVGLGWVCNTMDDESLRTKVVKLLKQDSELVAAKNEYLDSLNPAEKNVVLKREQARYEADVLNSTLEESAWSNLVREWGFVDNSTAQGGSIEESCRMLARNGYRCLAARGSLAELERYNVPVVIQLMDSNLTPFYAVLTGLSKTYAVLVLNGREWVVERAWVESSMEGDYRLLWPLPGGEEMVKSTSNKESQTLLSQMLAGYFMDSSLSFNGWNSAIAQKVREVQANNGLMVDGIAGVDTLWVLLPFADTGHGIKRDNIKPFGDANLNLLGAKNALNKQVFSGKKQALNQQAEVEDSSVSAETLDGLGATNTEEFDNVGLDANEANDDQSFEHPMPTKKYEVIDKPVATNIVNSGGTLNEGEGYVEGGVRVNGRLAQVEPPNRNLQTQETSKASKRTDRTTKGQESSGGLSSSQDSITLEELL